MAEDKMVHPSIEEPSPAAEEKHSVNRCVVLAVLAAAAAVYTTRAVLVRVLIALFVAISLDPAVRLLTRRGMRRGLAVLLIFLVASGLVAAFLVSVIPAMVHQFQALVHDFPGYVANLQDRSARFRELSRPLPSDQQGPGPAREPPRPPRKRPARLHPPPVRGAVLDAHRGGADHLLHDRHAPPAARRHCGCSRMLTARSSAGSPT